MPDFLDESIDIHGLQHAILTCVTAGPGLGFNRAALFLADEDQTCLGSAMAIGPATPEEASETWAHLARGTQSLRELLHQTPESTARGGFQRLLEGLTISLSGSNQQAHNPLLRSYWSGEVVRMTDAEAVEGLTPRLREVFSGTEIVCVPLVAKNRSLGLIVADNAFNRVPIADNQVQLLQVLAFLAALALDGARLYRQADLQSRRLQETLDELRAAQEQLLHNDRLATVGAVVARVSHEIRNPLTTIGGFARSLGAHPGEEARVRRNAGIIVDEVEKLESLLKEMLDFTSPKPPLFARTDLNKVLGSLASVHQEELAHHDITLRLQLADDLPHVIADANQLQRVFLNLWQNAVQAMQDEPVERLRVLTVSTVREGDAVLISFADSGPGVPRNVLPNIFTPFFTTKQRGTGLGLAVVKKVLDDHRATVRVESEPGGGTTFLTTFAIGRGT